MHADSTLYPSGFLFVSLSLEQQVYLSHEYQSEINTPKAFGSVFWCHARRLCS